MKTRSMNQKISYRLFFLSIFGFALAGIIFTSIFYNAYKRQVWNDLSTEATGIANAYAHFATSENLSVFASEDVHVTLLSSQGDILYESKPQVEHAQILGESPEFITALVDGTGSDERLNKTLGTVTYYYAILLSDGNLLHLGQQAQSLWAIFYEALPAIILTCICFILFALGAAYLLTRSIITPISDMARDLEHIQNNVPYKELSPFVSAIYSDRLLRANNEKIRQEFTANVSHELKSPLTSISGYAELICAGMAKPQDIPNFAEKIHAEARRMITLVEDILRLSQLDNISDLSDLNSATTFEQLNLYDLGKECFERQGINAKRAFVTLSFEGQDAFINGNRKLLGELFQNLCDNAIRYNKPGGKVVILVGRNANNIAYLKVRDNGIGIPKESQARIFERFYRVDKSHSKETGGTGLGLAIVKHIVLVHDAHLKLESELGTGTEIEVQF